jgi:hypothetical protein
LWERSADGKKDTDRLWARKNDDEEIYDHKILRHRSIVEETELFFPGDESCEKSLIGPNRSLSHLVINIFE